MIKNTKYIALFILLLIFPSVLFCQGVTSSAVIKIASGAYIDITDGGYENITNTTDGEINLEGSITLDGDWANNASNSVFSNLNTTGTVTFDGGFSQTISGSNTTSFENLTLNKTANNVALGCNISVYNNLTLTSGSIDLQNYDIDLGATGSLIGENTTNYIFVSDPQNHTGSILANSSVNNQTINIGNLGFEITTTENLGTINVARGHQKQSGYQGHTSDQGISRYYDVNIGELSANTTIKMNYLESELGAFDENNLILYQLVDDGSKAYDYAPLNSTLDVAQNTIESSSDPYSDYLNNNPGVSFLNNFTISSSSAPLPIEMLSFEANCLGNNKTQVQWVTATETNVSAFLLEHSTDLEIWTTLSNIDAAGNLNSTQEYFITHEQSSLINYYRLSQIDKNGTIKAIDIIESNCYQKNTSSQITTIANCKDGSIKISFYSAQSKVYHIKLFDIMGRVVMDKDYMANEGKNLIHIPSNYMKGAMHFIILDDDSIIAKEKLISLY